MRVPTAIPEFLAFGDLGVDSIALIDHLPRADEKLWVEPAGDYAGGMMGNTAAVVAALGVTAGVVALLGDDEHADLVIEDLVTRGVDHRFVRRVNAATFWTLSLTTPDGHRTLIQFPTVAFAADWDGFDRSLLGETRWVHTTAEQGEPVGPLLEAAHASEATTSLDVEYPFVLRKDLGDLLRVTDVAFANRAAAGALGGTETGARKLQELGARTIVVTLGEEGCLVLDREGALTRIGAFDVEPVDTNGAGDAFAGSFAAARLWGWSDREASEFANMVAAISTTAMGGHGAALERDRLSEKARTAGHDWWDRLS